MPVGYGEAWSRNIGIERMVLLHVEINSLGDSRPLLKSGASLVKEGTRADALGVAGGHDASMRASEHLAHGKT